jgi:hypothetical protein
VLQQRAAGEAPLHKPPHVCPLMHVGAAQARTRGRQERPFVSPAEQVRVGCRRRGMPCPLTRSSLCAYCLGGCSTRIYVDNGKYRGLVRLCGVMRWAAGLLYAPGGDEEAGGRHIAPEDTPWRNRSLIDDGVRDLGVSVL